MVLGAPLLGELLGVGGSRDLQEYTELLTRAGGEAFYLAEVLAVSIVPLSSPLPVSYTHLTLPTTPYV